MTSQELSEQKLAAADGCKVSFGPYVRCDAPVFLRGLVGCVHEHVKESTRCRDHRNAHSWCRECFLADGHFCRITFVEAP